MFLALLFVVVIILFRVGTLQSTDVYQNQWKNLKRNHLREVWKIPVRGQIYDRNGTPLASSVKVQTVAMDPFAVRTLSEKRRAQVFKKLEDILGVSVGDLHRWRTLIVLITSDLWLRLELLGRLGHVQEAHSGK